MVLLFICSLANSPFAIASRFSVHTFLILRTSSSIPEDDIENCSKAEPAAGFAEASSDGSEVDFSYLWESSSPLRYQKTSKPLHLP